MRMIFFQRSNGKSPVKDFIEKLGPKDRAKVLGCLQNIEDLGLDCPRVLFRQIKGKLWEIKIKAATAGYRIFYVCLNLKNIVLLHCYKKQSQKAPKREIEVAEKRMVEVLNNEQDYT